MTAVATEQVTAGTARLPRAIASTRIRFAELSIPVRLSVAQKRSEIEFRTLHEECGWPIERRKWCPYHDREVTAEECVRAWEFSGGQFIPFPDGELEPLKLDGLLIEQTVRVDDVPELWLDTTYYLLPADDPTGRAAYDLLLHALDTKVPRGGIGRVIVFGHEHLVLVRPLEGLLCLTTLYLPEDVRLPGAIVATVGKSSFPREARMLARQLVAEREVNVEDAFALAMFGGPVMERRSMKAALADKLAAVQAGKEQPITPSPEVATLDLIAALRASIRPPAEA